MLEIPKRNGHLFEFDDTNKNAHWFNLFNEKRIYLLLRHLLINSTLFFLKRWGKMNLLNPNKKYERFDFFDIEYNDMISVRAF